MIVSFCADGERRKKYEHLKLLSMPSTILFYKNYKKIITTLLKHLTIYLYSIYLTLRFAMVDE